MNEFDFGPRARPQKRKAQRSFDGKIQYLLSGEEQLLRSISSRVLLPKVLNEICSVLDCQIGNVVSLISLPGDDASQLAAIAMSAAQFGLYTYCSEGVAENDELLGSLEMYSSVPRSPSPGESQIIERAKCLAAIAIKRHNEASHQGKYGRRGNRPVRGRVLEWPSSMNQSLEAHKSLPQLEITEGEL